MIKKQIILSTYRGVQGNLSVSKGQENFCFLKHTEYRLTTRFCTIHCANGEVKSQKERSRPKEGGQKIKGCV